MLDIPNFLKLWRLGSLFVYEIILLDTDEFASNVVLRTFSRKKAESERDLLRSQGKFAKIKTMTVTFDGAFTIFEK